MLHASFRGFMEPIYTTGSRHPPVFIEEKVVHEEEEVKHCSLAVCHVPVRQCRAEKLTLSKLNFKSFLSGIIKPSVCNGRCLKYCGSQK